jgi:hypothetical protein
MSYTDRIPFEQMFESENFASVSKSWAHSPAYRLGMDYVLVARGLMTLVPEPGSRLLSRPNSSLFEPTSARENG